MQAGRDGLRSLPRGGAQTGEPAQPLYGRITLPAALFCSTRCADQTLLQLGEVSAEAAAGLHYEERRAQLEALHLLLQSQACGEERLDDPAFKALCQFNALLLKSVPGSRMGALHLLLAAAKVGLQPRCWQSSTGLKRMLDWCSRLAACSCSSTWWNVQAAGLQGRTTAPVQPVIARAAQRSGCCCRTIWANQQQAAA